MLSSVQSSSVHSTNFGFLLDGSLSLKSIVPFKYLATLLPAVQSFWFCELTFQFSIRTAVPMPDLVVAVELSHSCYVLAIV